MKIFWRGYYLFFCLSLFGLLLGKEQFSIEWYVQYATDALLRDGSDIDMVFFSPDDEIKNIILGLIHAEQKSIRMAFYKIYDRDIIDALYQAKQRGVTIVVVTDCSSFLEKYERVTQMQAHGIEVRSYTLIQGIMHNKFFLFEKSIGNQPLVIAGSANMTLWAYSKNEENVQFRNKKAIVDRYMKKFELLEKKSTIPMINFLFGKDLIRNLFRCIHGD